MKEADKKFLPLFYFLAALFITLAMIGGVESYSPVPFWDMWNGYLGFYCQANEVGSWWAQHNEHRIVLSRLLFWIDLAFFEGDGWFLIGMNYFFLGAVCILLWHISKERLGSKEEIPIRRILGCICVVLLSSWIQENNFIWGFQSQFILAQAMPFFSFFCLYRASLSSHSKNRLFVVSCVLGILSIGTMANGILALPLMVPLALVLRMGWKRAAVLVSLSVLTIFFYFYDYASPSRSSFLEAFREAPMEILQYMSIFLGGPFYYMTRSVFLPQIASIFLIGSAAVFLWKAYKPSPQSSLEFFLLTFLLYIGGTALGAGCGRIDSGAIQSLSSRYQTPTLMAWATLLILYAPIVKRWIKRQPVASISFLALIPILLLPHQLEVFGSKKEMRFQRMVAALALELQINDSQIAEVYPMHDGKNILEIARIASERKLSIFNHPAIRDARKSIGKTETTPFPNRCEGALEQIAMVKNDFRNLRIRGWAYQPDRKNAPRSIRFLDKDRRIIGFALTGQPRPDIEKKIAPSAKYAGFKGYLLAGRTPVTLKGFDPDCEMEIQIGPEILVAWNLLPVNIPSRKKIGETSPHCDKE